MCVFVFFFFKQKTAYEMRISDWSSDVCSSDLARKKRAKATSGRWKINLGPSSGLRPVEIHREFMTAAARWTMALKLWSVLSALMAIRLHSLSRSEERRVGKVCVSTCRSRLSAYHSNKTEQILHTSCINN